MLFSNYHMHLNFPDQWFKICYLNLISELPNQQLTQYL